MGFIKKIIILSIITINFVSTSPAYGVTLDHVDGVLLQNPGGVINLEGIEERPEQAAVGALPKVDFAEITATAIKYVLGLAMVFTFIAIIVAAIFYLTAQGEEENIKKAKDIIIYLIIGMAIMAAAYAITIGISQFQFLN